MSRVFGREGQQERTRSSTAFISPNAAAAPPNCVAVKGIKSRRLRNSVLSYTTRRFPSRDVDELRSLLEVFKGFQWEVPNLVQLLSLVEVPGQPCGFRGQEVYLLMEWVDGDSLEAALTNTSGAGLGQMKACRIFDQLMLGVQALHREGVAHRDLKPANVMLTSSPSAGTVKICDFDFAWPCARLGASGAWVKQPVQLSPKGAAGTLKYLSPPLRLHRTLVEADEMQRKSVCKRYDAAAADAWALAVILIEMLGGSPKESIAPVERILRREYQARGRMLEEACGSEGLDAEAAWQTNALREELWQIFYGLMPGGKNLHPAVLACLRNLLDYGLGIDGPFASGSPPLCQVRALLPCLATSH